MSKTKIMWRDEGLIVKSVRVSDTQVYVFVFKKRSTDKFARTRTFIQGYDYGEENRLASPNDVFCEHDTDWFELCV